MQAATAQAPKSKPLIFARQIVGMAILALANPLVWYSNEPVLRWLESWGVPVLIALAAFGLLCPGLHEARQASLARPILPIGLGACGVGDCGTVD